MGPSVCQSRRSIDSDTDKAPHMVTGVTREFRQYSHMVTGVTEVIREYPDMVTRIKEEIRYSPHMVTEIQEDVTYCCLGTSSGKQKNARSTSQPPFCSENTPAIIEADQILLALQQLASNSNSAKINNNVNRISKLPKSLTTTMPTFDGKPKKPELFENLFQTSLKLHN